MNLTIMLYKEYSFILLLIFFSKSTGYNGIYSSNLNEVYETIPSKVSSKGHHLTYNTTTFHSDPEEWVHFNLSIGSNTHFLVLRPTRSFFIPSLVIERRNRNNFVREQPFTRTKNCHFKGFVHKQERSKVALSACNGLTGVILLDKEEYYLEPYRHPTKLTDFGHKHLIYKRSAVKNNYPRKKKRRRRQINCGTRVPRRWTLLEKEAQERKSKFPQKKSRHKPSEKVSNMQKNHKKSIKYKEKSKKTDRPNRNERSISKDYYVETLIVADASMVEFHKDGNIETYILTLLNMVSLLFQDPSIGNSVNIVVVKIILIEDESAEPVLHVNTNADITLRNFCKWQLSLNYGKDDHPHHHDVAILITRKDICARQDTPCGTLGVAHIGGMCTPSKSCNVNEDNGITSAHTIAHELGHNFGMIHDSEKAGCHRRDGTTIHIMTPNFEADTVSVNWSNCSRREMTRFLDKGLGQCLEDKPNHLNKYKYPDLPAGVMYDANYQCRLQFGKNATLCTPPDEICLHLWCSVNNTCTTFLRPAAEGTFCGKHKWCHNRECVLMLEPPEPTDGNWGNWTTWSECSRTCGGGVSVMSRDCNHPIPAYGGKYCVGERTRYRMCNTQPCLSGQPSFRAVQCSLYDDQLYEGKKYKWQPYFDNDEPCQLYCSDANETVVASWGEYAKDGTPCSVVSKDICISGICKIVGCDWVVDSKAVEDDCGICHGDGSKCYKKQGIYNKQNWSPGYREVVVIPKGARNIRIEETDYSTNFISIGSALERNFYLNEEGHVAMPGEYSVAGAQTFYARDNQLEKIHIPGPIKEPIVVYVYYRGNAWNPGVEYKYSIWKHEYKNKIKYMWISDEWSQCSVTCGKGVHHRKYLCQKSIVSSVPLVKETHTIVEDYYCQPKKKPKNEIRSCFEDNCPSRWWVGPWQTCAATCLKKGAKPITRRSVICVDDKEMALPDEYCDKTVKPFEFEPCSDLPICDDM